MIVRAARNASAVGARELFYRHEHAEGGRMHVLRPKSLEGRHLQPDADCRATVAAHLQERFRYLDVEAMLADMERDPFGFNERMHRNLQDANLTETTRRGYPNHGLSLCHYFMGLDESVGSDPRFMAYCDAMTPGDDIMKRDPNVTSGEGRLVALVEYEPE